MALPVPGPQGELSPSAFTRWGELPESSKRPETPIPCDFAHLQEKVMIGAKEHVRLICDWRSQRRGVSTQVLSITCERCMAAGLPNNDNPVLQASITTGLLCRLAAGDTVGLAWSLGMEDALAMARKRKIPKWRLLAAMLSATVSERLSRARLKAMLGHLALDRLKRNVKIRALALLVERYGISVEQAEELRSDLGI